MGYWQRDMLVAEMRIDTCEIELWKVAFIEVGLVEVNFF